MLKKVKTRAFKRYNNVVSDKKQLKFVNVITTESDHQK